MNTERSLGKLLFSLFYLVLDIGELRSGELCLELLQRVLELLPHLHLRRSVREPSVFDDPRRDTASVLLDVTVAHHVQELAVVHRDDNLGHLSPSNTGANT